MSKKTAVKTLYTANFYATPSSSESTHPRPSSSKTPHMDNLFGTHLAFQTVREAPPSRPASPESQLAHSERVEELRKKVVEAYHAANGNPASGKWGLITALLQTSTAKSRYRWLNTRTDAVTPRPPPGGWRLPDTEEEALEWETQRKEERRLIEEAKAKVQAKVENWKRTVDVDAEDDVEESQVTRVGEEPRTRKDSPPPPARPHTKNIAAEGSKGGHKNTARSIAELPEVAFLPPSFPSHLVTSTPPIAGRSKPSPIQLVPSSSPISPANNHRRDPPSSDSPSKIIAAYSSGSRLKRQRSLSPTPVHTPKKARAAPPSSPGPAPPITPSPSKPLSTAPFTPPANPLPKLADLLAASAQKAKAKAKAKAKEREQKGKQVAQPKPPSPPHIPEEPSPARQHDIEVLAKDVINWEAMAPKDPASTDPIADVSPTKSHKSLSSIDDSDSLGSRGNDLPDFSNGALFEPQGASTQPMGLLGEESIGTSTEMGARGFGQQSSGGGSFGNVFPMQYESQIDVENNVQRVEALLHNDVGQFVSAPSPWMGAGPDNDDDDDGWGHGKQVDSSP